MSWLGLASGVLVLTGCPEDAVEVTKLEATALNFAVAPLAGIGFPRGPLSVDNLVVLFDTTVADGWARATDQYPGFDGAAFVFGDPLTGDQDTRAPTMQSGTVAATSAGLEFFPPSEGPFDAVGGGTTDDPDGHWWVIISGALGGLPANTTYTLALVRYGTVVKAELDQNAILEGLPITEPDSLVILNENEGGDVTFVVGAGTVPANADTLTFGSAPVGTNPWILGQGTTDANGDGDFGFVLPARDGGGNVVYEADASVVPPTAALSVPGNNDGSAWDLPRFNYLVMFEGVGTSGQQIARWQIAQDLDLNGQPLNNGYYPTPTAALTPAEILATPGGSGFPDSISVEIFNAERLAGGAVYQAWLYNREADPPTLTSATATYERVAIVRELDPVTGEIISEEDVVLETVSSTSSFVGELEAMVPDKEMPQEVKHRLIISDGTTGGGANGPGQFTDIIISIESGPATTPSEERPLWAQYTSGGVASSGPLSFGHFDAADPPSSRVFLETEFIQSSGLGGVLAVGNGFPEVSVDIRNLPLPPPGYFYEGWLFNPLTGEGLSMGPITSLPPDTVSLFDADMDQSLPGVTPTGIQFSNAFVALAQDELVAPDPGLETQIVKHTQFLLTLEPKSGAANKNIADLQVGSIPVEAILARFSIR